MNSYRLTHLQELEAESIFVLREVAAQFEKPVLLFSGGKDSIVVSHLARKAFWPAKIPFPADAHRHRATTSPRRSPIGTAWMETIGAKLIVRYVQDSIDQGRAVEEKGFNASRNLLQTVTLLDALEELKIDAAIGGARRDEEKARAKERFFSHRDEFGQWDPKNQRPELWNIFNGKKHLGEHFRVFPISNWTEMDVWQYMHRRRRSPCRACTSPISAPSSTVTACCSPPPTSCPCKPGETPQERQVRFRTIGDMTCTGAVLSPANSMEEIIQEVAATRQTERGTRADDKRSEAAMEDRKKEGYF